MKLQPHYSFVSNLCVFELKAEQEEDSTRETENMKICMNDDSFLVIIIIKKCSEMEFYLIFSCDVHFYCNYDVRERLVQIYIYSTYSVFLPQNKGNI